jgi:hypothetical protein
LAAPTTTRGEYGGLPTVPKGGLGGVEGYGGDSAFLFCCINAFFSGVRDTP